MSSSCSFAAAIPRVSAGARIVAGARRAAPVGRPPHAAPVGTSGRVGEEEERNLATPGVRQWWRRRGAPALTRAARGYESASTSTSTSKSTDDADRAKPPPKKDYRRNRRPKAASGAAAKPRYNRPPLRDPSSSADAGTDEDSHAPRPPGGDRPKWLSHQHTVTPGKQPQQRRGPEVLGERLHPLLPGTALRRLAEVHGRRLEVEGTAEAEGRHRGVFVKPEGRARRLVRWRDVDRVVFSR